jgi:hypothetical protein
LIPPTNAAFWGSSAVMFLIALILYLRTPHRSEPGHRSPLPVWIKFPSILGVVLALVLLKSFLYGFMTVFPMVGVVTAYEARHSLWTICRQMPVIILTLLSMVVTLRLLQGTLGIGWAMAVGWAVFMVVLIPLMRTMWARDRKNS